MHKTSPSKIWRHAKNRYTLGVAEKERHGTLVSWSCVHAAPEGFESDVPYVIAIVVCGDKKSTAQIVDCDPEKLVIGQKLVSTFRKISQDGDSGVIHYGLKWRPVQETVS